MDSVLKSINSKNYFIRVLILLICMFLMSIVYNLILNPVKLVTGGTGGLSIVLNSITGINNSLIVLIINSIIIIISLIFLDFKKTNASIVASISYPVFIYLTSFFLKDIFIDGADLILVTLVGAVTMGVINGICYLVGFNSGGTAILAQIISEKCHLNYAVVKSYVNGVVVLFGVFTFGLTMALYAILFIMIESVVTNKMILGISSNKLLFIISDKEDEIKNYVMNELNKSITILPCKGGVSNTNKHIIMSVVPNRDYFKMTSGIKKIDKDVFFIIHDTYEVLNG